MLVPSSGLLSTIFGVIAGVVAVGVVISLSSASSSMKAENRICSPAVPFTAATFPARVLMLLLLVSCFFWAKRLDERPTATTRIHTHRILKGPSFVETERPRDPGSTGRKGTSDSSHLLILNSDAKPPGSNPARVIWQRQLFRNCLTTCEAMSSLGLGAGRGVSSCKAIPFMFGVPVPTG